VTELVARSVDLKRELVAFAQHPRFTKALRTAVSRLPAGRIRDEADKVNLLDSFVIGHRLPDGRTLIDSFVATRRDLGEREREMLLGWRDPVEGLFEVQRRDDQVLLLLNLVDELTYRVHSNMGTAIFAKMPPRSFVMTRLVPVGGDWLFSGRQRLVRASARREVARLVAELSLESPALVFRNPEKLKRAWELQRGERERFIDFFGADLIILSRDERDERLQAYWTFRDREAAGGKPSPGWTPSRHRNQRSPAPGPLPFGLDDLPDSDTVGVIFDETEGLSFFLDFGLVAEVFDRPELVTAPRHRRVVRGYLDDESVSPLAFRRLAERDPSAASRVFQLLLKRPAFVWEADGEALLRRHKAACYARTILPRVTPVSGIALEYYRPKGRAWIGGIWR